MGFLQEPSSTENRKVLTNGNKSKRSPDVLAALASVIPQLKVILGENDRILNAVNSIITERKPFPATSTRVSWMFYSN